MYHGMCLVCLMVLVRAVLWPRHSSRTSQPAAGTAAVTPAPGTAAVDLSQLAPASEQALHQQAVPRMAARISSQLAAAAAALLLLVHPLGHVLLLLLLLPEAAQQG